MGERRKGEDPERKSESKKPRNIRQAEGQNTEIVSSPLDGSVERNISNQYAFLLLGLETERRDWDKIEKLEEEVGRRI